MDMVRTMMITSNLPAPFWGETAKHCVLVNIPTTALDPPTSNHRGSPDGDAATSSSVMEMAKKESGVYVQQQQNRLDEIGLFL